MRWKMYSRPNWLSEPNPPHPGKSNGRYPAHYMATYATYDEQPCTIYRPDVSVVHVTIIVACWCTETYNYIRQRSWANVMYSPLFVTLRKSEDFSQSILVTAVCLLLFEIFDFRKVYWSPRFVTLRKTFRKVYWSPRFVCVFVCLSVFKGSTGRTARPIVLILFAEDVIWSRDNAELFFLKIG